MAFSKCNNCKKKVPIAGQCSGCGFVHGLNRMPSDDEFRQARKVNQDHNHELFQNIDMLLLDLEEGL